ncbi:Glucose N-acetyltransferase 1 [Fusarium oligoseptatum]|uniref:Glucose N-acetyltransferase 1 n=1 Tax=Fusarium oligoseptatum TaxID=2604345 RepID=A0A428UDH0_9HYPO|nr:Glucose N-acetyltransferase 1 [Fusarium oligoseptatum]
MLPSTMSRLLRFLPSLIFLSIFFCFLLNLFEYDYPDVPLPNTWRAHRVEVPESAGRPGGYPGSPSFMGGENVDAQDNDGHGTKFVGDGKPSDGKKGAISNVDIDDSEFHDDSVEEKEETEEDVTESTDSDIIDWSRFAYVQYVTNDVYLCNSLMIFEALQRLGSNAERLMMYPGHMLEPDARESDTHVGQLLIKARDEYKVTLRPVEIQRRNGSDVTWAESFTKLLAFNQTQYDRVISLDSDGVVLQLMDELFQLPPCRVAMPRAYWFMKDDPPKTMLASHVMVIQPDKVEMERIFKKIETIENTEYDMEVINGLYLDSAMIIPHRPYGLLSAEFRMKDHSQYLGSKAEKWDAVSVLNEAKYVHFSDWPVPKPWVQDSAMRLQKQPQCRTADGKETQETCAEREIWNKLYTDFVENRKVSRMVSVDIPFDELLTGYQRRFVNR